MAWIKTEKTGSLNALSDVNITSPAGGNSLVYDETTGKWINGEGGGGNANEMVLTQDEYDALTPEEQLNGTNYYINDASVGAQSAAGTPYDNTQSSLLATDVQDAIDELVINKVDAVNGKGLSTEDYTSAEKTKLSGIAAGAEVNVQADWNEVDTNSDAYIANKPNVITTTELTPQTLTTGSTSLVFTDAAITTTSTIDIYTDPEIPHNNITGSAGTITVTFDEQDSDVEVKVRVS